MDFNELKKASMAFQTKNGEVLLIDKEDIKEIAMKIIVEGSCTKQIVFMKEKDMSIQNADLLYNIIKTTKDMVPKVLTKYLLQISDILGQSQKLYENIDTGEQVLLTAVEIKK